MWDLDDKKVGGAYNAATSVLSRPRYLTPRTLKINAYRAYPTGLWGVATLDRSW